MDSGIVTCRDFLMPRVLVGGLCEKKSEAHEYCKMYNFCQMGYGKSNVKTSKDSLVESFLLFRRENIFYNL